MDLIRAVERLVAPLWRRTLLMVGRAVLRVVDDEAKLQAVQVEGLAGEVLDRAERFQGYGLSSHPHPGAECVLLAVGGQRQHPIVVAIDDRRHRPTGLAAGEVCLYTDEHDPGAPHRVILGRGREIRLECGASSIVMTPSEILLSAGHIGLNDP